MSRSPVVRPAIVPRLPVARRTQAGAGTPTIAAGQLHTLLVKPDGAVWAWGFNDTGQLGDGTTTDSLHPISIASPADVWKIASSNAVWAEHSLAVTGAGEVWAWGKNSRGQLGDGTTTTRLTPFANLNLFGMTNAKAGEEHSIALKSDGTVWSSGANGFGQLGHDGTTDQWTPGQVSNGNRTTARTDDTPLLYAYNNMNRLTTQSGGGVVRLDGTTNEPASVTIAGSPARGAGTNAFAGSAVLASGTSIVAIAAHVTNTYEWNAANELTRVLDSGIEIARFAYDGYGRRAEKVTAVARAYVYDGSDIVQERVGTSTTRIVHGPGIDQPLASIDPGGTVSYYLADHLGSIVQQTNAAGAVTLTRQYDPYGVALQGAAVSGYAFTGREWDAETSLHYYRSRYYSSDSSRFLSEDSAGLAQGPNLYSYVGNIPNGFRDPSGHQGAAALIWGATAAGAAGGTLVAPGPGTIVGALGMGLGAAVVLGAAAILGSVSQGDVGGAAEALLNPTGTRPSSP